MASPNATATPSSWRSRCRTNRSALFLPIPGSFEISLTALSSKEDEKELFITGKKKIFVSKVAKKSH